MFEHATPTCVSCFFASSASGAPPMPPRRSPARAPRAGAAVYHARTLSTACGHTSACDGDTGGTSRGVVSTRRADRPDTARSATASRRGGTGCTPGSCPSPCQAYKDCNARARASLCHAGSQCVRCSYSSARRVRTRRTSRSYPYVARAGTARAPTSSRERSRPAPLGMLDGGSPCGHFLSARRLTFREKRTDAPSSTLHSSVARAREARRTSATRSSRACSRVEASRIPCLPRADPTSRRESSSSWQSPSARHPGSRSPPSPGTSPPSRRVVPRRTGPCSNSKRGRPTRPAEHPRRHRCARASCPTQVCGASSRRLRRVVAWRAPRCVPEAPASSRAPKRARRA